MGNIPVVQDWGGGGIGAFPTVDIRWILSAGSKEATPVNREAATCFYIQYLMLGGPLSHLTMQRDCFQLRTKDLSARSGIFLTSSSRRLCWLPTRPISGKEEEREKRVAYQHLSGLPCIKGHHPGS